MIVLGIDPGYERVGIAVLKKEMRDRESLIYSSCFKTSAKLPFVDRLLDIVGEVERIIIKYKPKAMAIENLFLSSNQKTAMRVSEVRGAILYLAVSRDLKIREYTPLQIKSAITGHGRSDKNAMVKMLPNLVKISKKINHDDEYDAIGAALTYFAYGESFPQAGQNTLD